MRLCIEPLPYASFLVDIDESHTVQYLRAQIAERTKCPPEEQVLILNENGRTLWRGVAWEWVGMGLDGLVWFVFFNIACGVFWFVVLFCILCGMFLHFLWHFHFCVVCLWYVVLCARRVRRVRCVRCVRCCGQRFGVMLIKWF